MHHAVRFAAVILLGALAAGCATPEYQQAQQACHREWLSKIPPDYRQVLVTRERRTEVPDGTETCTTAGGTRRCEKGMRTEWVPYTAVDTVDANAQQRGYRIQECARARCLRIYGNPDCKV